MPSDIAVIAETAAGQPAPVTMELIAFAKALRGDGSAPIRVFVLGAGIEQAAAGLAALPGTAVTAFEGRDLGFYSAEAWNRVLAPRIAALKPRLVCVAHDAAGADFGPALAARLGAACITSVDGFRRGPEGIVFSRPMLKGKMRMEVVPESDTTVLTLLPGSFRGGERLLPDGPAAGGEPPAPESLTPPGSPEIVPVPELPLKTRPLGPASAQAGDADLAGAEVVVAAGRGIACEANLSLLRRLAAVFSRSALGASRAVCDAGWLPHRLQIGQTGQTVAPRLYIACGISGAPQHLAGMRGSRCIVAINRDPAAAIFQTADIAVVEDLVSFVPLLVEACRRAQGGGKGAGS